ARFTAGPDTYAKFSWVDGINPYVKSKQVFYCPSDSVKVTAAYQPAGKYGAISYGMSNYLNGYVTQSSGPRITDNYNHTGSQALASIVSPSNKILLGDKFKGSAYP